MKPTRERFDAGLTYEQLKAKTTRSRERLEANERDLAIYASDLVALKSLAEPLNVLAIVEDWAITADLCPETVEYLPVLGRLAADSGMLNVRVFSRDANPDLVDLYGADLDRKDGKLRSTPVFVFLDSAFGEIGRFVGRPADLAEESPLGGTADLALRELVEIVKQHQARLSSVRRLRPPQAVKPKHPVKVTITYCAACGYEPQTLELVKALMLGPRFDLSSIEIVVGEEGAFEVTVGSELVHSMYRDGGFPESEKVIEAVKEAVER